MLGIYFNLLQTTTDPIAHYHWKANKDKLNAIPN